MHKIDTARYTLKEAFSITGAFYTHNGTIGASFFKNIEFNDRVDSYIGTSKFFSKNLIPLMKNIKVPTLIICGDDDFICDHVSQSDSRKWGYYLKLAGSRLMMTALWS